jgi:Rrf2 family transcriptional regulator, cysteine metabolism repressor
MSSVSQKCQYALRAVFELARTASSEPLRIADIAEAQAIPPRFLEVILAQLKQGGFVDSRRGNKGGYVLGRAAAEITVGDLIRFVDGPMHPVKCLEAGGSKCTMRGSCPFMWVWDGAAQALADVYDGVTIQELVERDEQSASHEAVDFAI